MSQTPQEIIEHGVRKQIRRETPINIVEKDNQRLGINHQDFLKKLTTKCTEDNLDVKNFTKDASVGDITLTRGRE